MKPLTAKRALKAAISLYEEMKGLQHTNREKVIEENGLPEYLFECPLCQYSTEDENGSTEGRELNCSKCPIGINWLPKEKHAEYEKKIQLSEYRGDTDFVWCEKEGSPYYELTELENNGDGFIGDGSDTDYDEDTEIILQECIDLFKKTLKGLKNEQK